MGLTVGRTGGSTHNQQVVVRGDLRQGSRSVECACFCGCFASRLRGKSQDALFDGSMAREKAVFVVL